MTCEEVLQRLAEIGDPKIRDRHIKNGATGAVYGTKTADLRVLAKQIKTDHDLADELWATGGLDARFVATLIVKAKAFAPEKVEQWILDATYAHLADYVNTNVLKPHPDKESMRVRWMSSDVPTLSRAGWSLTTERVIKSPDGLDLNALLDRIEAEMATADPLPQWTMNYCLAEIGIRHPELRPRALAIGEKLGVYRDYKVSKGCTSPFAPIWIGAIVGKSDS